MKNHDTKKVDYPAETSGSLLGADFRRKANRLSEEERDELFKRGMQVIYGGNGEKEATRARP